MPSSPSSPSSPTTHATTPPQPLHHKGAFGFKPPAQGCVELDLKPTGGAFGFDINDQQGCVGLLFTAQSSANRSTTSIKMPNAPGVLDGGTPRRNIILTARCSWRGHLRGAHIHYCPVFLEGTPERGTDKTKITRKPSKTGKHGHENGRAQKKPGIQSQSQSQH
ncbi:hypothetical protein Tco_1502271 [Tanacetum coccineum]